SLLYRFRKRARRHKGLVVALAIALAAVVALTIQQLRSRYLLAERARVARELGRDARDLESILRYAYTMPLHDTRADRARVLERMKAIEAKAARLGEVAEGASEYALGRGYLALHDDAAARAHLEAAWARGQRDAQVRYALGLAYGGLYRRALEEAEQRAVGVDGVRRGADRALRGAARRRAQARLDRGRAGAVALRSARARRAGARRRRHAASRRRRSRGRAGGVRARRRGVRARARDRAQRRRR